MAVYQPPSEFLPTFNPSLFSSNDSAVTLTGVQTLTNKNLSSSSNIFPSTLVNTTGNQTISGDKVFSGSFGLEAFGNDSFLLPNLAAANNSIYTLPDEATTLVGIDTNDTLQNKELYTTNCLFVDTANPLKKLQFDIASNSSGITGTLKTQFTSTRTVSIPDQSGTLALTTTSITPNTLQVSSNGTLINRLQFGKTIISGVSGTITFPNAFSSAPTVTATLEQVNTSYLFSIQITSTSTTNFTWRQYLITIANPSQCTVAGNTGAIHWVAMN